MTSVGVAGPSGRYCQMAVILGTSEIASAIAVHLHRDRYGVVLSHDPAAPPVIRRKMAFYDALFDDAVIVDGVAARRADTGSEIRLALGRRDAVIITELGLLDRIVVRPLDLLIDARMQKYDLTPDLRPLAHRDRDRNAGIQEFRDRTSRPCAGACAIRRAPARRRS